MIAAVYGCCCETILILSAASAEIPGPPRPRSRRCRRCHARFYRRRRPLRSRDTRIADVGEPADVGRDAFLPPLVHRVVDPDDLEQGRPRTSVSTCLVGPRRACSRADDRSWDGHGRGERRRAFRAAAAPAPPSPSRKLWVSFLRRVSTGSSASDFSRTNAFTCFGARVAFWAVRCGSGPFGVRFKVSGSGLSTVLFSYSLPVCSLNLPRPPRRTAAPGRTRQTALRVAFDVRTMMPRSTRRLSRSRARYTSTSNMFWSVRFETRSYSLRCSITLRSISSSRCAVVRHARTEGAQRVRGEPIGR